MAQKPEMAPKPEQEHRDIFSEDDALDLNRFKPKTPDASAKPAPEDLRGIAERTKFVSREGQGASQPAKVPLLRRGQHRTGRSATVTLKTTPDASNRFYALAQAHGWLIGEAFERAVAALEREAGEGTHAS
jgi:hypothetical protein